MMIFHHFNLKIKNAIYYINNQLNKHYYSQETVLIHQSYILRFVKYNHIQNQH